MLLAKSTQAWCAMSAKKHVTLTKNYD